MAFCSKYKLNIFDAGKHLMVNDIEAKAEKHRAYKNGTIYSKTFGLRGGFINIFDLRAFILTYYSINNLF